MSADVVLKNDHNFERNEDPASERTLAAAFKTEFSSNLLRKVKKLNTMHQSLGFNNSGLNFPRIVSQFIVVD